jgi:cell division protein FtsL
VDNQHFPEKNSKISPTGTPPRQESKPVNPIPAEPATAERLTEVEKQMTGFEKATLRWAKIAVLLSGLAALFVCAQWYEMHQGSGDTHTLAEQATKQVEKMSDMSDAAEKIRIAAENMVTQDQRIADNAQKALNASIAMAHNEQRAWIIVPRKYGLVDFVANGPITFSVGFLNTGKTPAESVTAIVRAQVIANHDDPTFTYERGTSYTYRIGELVPNDEGAPQKVQARSDHIPIIVSADQLKRIQSGIEYVAIYGQVAYVDIAGSHWMRFCNEVNASQPQEEGETPNKCAQYSSSGDGKAAPIIQ